ncbi:MAG: hypothetical protein NW223_01090 [Hyphomicrobiaceae bacterium]|nr:hypothetical protein [Hyphomicrobiaceae bacterium]
MADITHDTDTEAQAQRAFLFHCTASWDRHAITLDLTGGNLPAGTCLTGWVFDREIDVSVSAPLPLPLPPEPVLRGLRSAGYYVWDGHIVPTATTQ